MSCFREKYLPIVSINYDFLPNYIEGKKSLWVDLVWPAPECLKIDSPVNIVSGKNVLVGLVITDIVGSRVLLSSLSNPNDSHILFDNRGYDLKTYCVSAFMHNTKYGYGASETYLKYISF